MFVTSISQRKINWPLMGYGHGHIGRATLPSLKKNIFDPVLSVERVKIDTSSLVRRWIVANSPVMLVPRQNDGTCILASVSAVCCASSSRV